MNPKEKFFNIISQKEDSRLALFVVSSHVDKPVLDSFSTSKYAIPIQAGAANTKERVCELNDYDGFSESISIDNYRYGEFSAVFWMWKNVDTPWIGISHYRRIYNVSDEYIAQLLDEKTDIITLKPISRNQDVSVKEQYRLDHYGYDWDVVMKLLHKSFPQFAEFADTIYDKPLFHPYAMSIMRKELFDEFCGMAFGIIRDFIVESAVKTDKYQRRDIGFLLERMLSAFVDFKIQQGKRVEEVDVRILKTDEWIPWDACDLSDEQSVMDQLSHLFKNQDIEKCIVLLSYIKCNSKKLQNLIFIFNLYMEERKSLRMTFLDYLQSDITGSLLNLSECFQIFEELIKNAVVDNTDASMALLVQYIQKNHLSDIVIYFVLAKCGCATESVVNDIVLSLLEQSVTDPVLPLLSRLLEKNANSQMTLLNIGYALICLGYYSEAKFYLEKIENQNDEMIKELLNVIKINNPN